MTIKFKEWERTDCDHCGSEFQVSRSEPREIKGDVICGDCEIFKKAFADGIESVTRKDEANEIRLKMINHAFTEYTKTVSNIMAHTNAHIIRIGKPFNQEDSK